jgi:hypothetical protein
LLPAAVLDRRDKGAFGLPIRQWFSGELAPLLKRIIFSPTALDRAIFDPVELRSGWHGTAALWSALSIELWFRIFMDRDLEWLDRIQTGRLERPPAPPGHRSHPPRPTTARPFS